MRGYLFLFRHLRVHTFVVHDNMVGGCAKNGPPVFPHVVAHHTGANRSALHALVTTKVAIDLNRGRRRRCTAKEFRLATTCSKLHSTLNFSFTRSSRCLF
ncbi:unnamed protein product [Amoebophrya sp. A25]|nr:unnamed protein product [Amoebophrya sp. A25]|eukprot:GSA25T00009871001.1